MPEGFPFIWVEARVRIGIGVGIGIGAGVRIGVGIGIGIFFRIFNVVLLESGNLFGHIPSYCRSSGRFIEVQRIAGKVLPVLHCGIHSRF